MRCRPKAKSWNALCSGNFTDCPYRSTGTDLRLHVIVTGKMGFYLFNFNQNLQLLLLLLA